MLALRTYYNSYLGADKARSASGRPTTRDAQHPESGVLNTYRKIYKYTEIGLDPDRNQLSILVRIYRTEITKTIGKPIPAKTPACRLFAAF